ncbi:Hypothetical predicted protein [Mytilus galloprovincialis]|uniref:Uncharacterized protein n=1 Tax=Mytilus galloprovincialis TaxID=29158 RepID=A0A8B6FBI9_MYTGA|nr:Hypothetical predicted protein [Mytilus galloprovincialis]
MTTVGKEVVYAQAKKPSVKREQSTSSQKSDDTYDHMDHRRLSQTHDPTESNYDTMRNIGNAGEEENSYDHVIGTNMEPTQVIVDIATKYSHVEVECNEVKDINQINKVFRLFISYIYDFKEDIGKNQSDN